MLSLNQSKFLSSLSVKKYRQQHGQFLVEGDKMVSELLLQSQIELKAVFGLERWAKEHVALLKPFSENFNLVTESELAKISALSTPNQVLAVATIPQVPCNVTLPAEQICFYLDGIQDPGNLGSILRIADWFGIPAVFCSFDCVDVFSPKVVQASMGAIFRVSSWEIDLIDLLEASPGIAIAGAVLDGEDVFKTTLPSTGLLVIGNEGRGISSEIERLLSLRLSIPRHPSGGAESLNAAVATGILAAAFRR